MKLLSRKDEIVLLTQQLVEWIREPVVDVHYDVKLPAGGIADAILAFPSYQFLLEYKSSAGVAAVDGAIQQIQDYCRRTENRYLPLIAVSYMGENGKKLCAKAGISWVDLSGNANISAPGLRILIEGKPNRFKVVGRPANAFAPKSARITRWLLMHPHTHFLQKELAQATDLDEGFVSQIVAQLRADGLVERSKNGKVYTPVPELLLQAWQEKYDFRKHQILTGHVAARNGELLIERLIKIFQAEKQTYSLTGLAAAWLYSHFAAFRLVSVYVETWPTQSILEQLGFREEERGGNLWLILPKDPGVFQGTTLQVDKICVHPVQVWLDLQAHPERAKDAAQRLYEHELKPKFL